MTGLRPLILLGVLLHLAVEWLQRRWTALLLTGTPRLNTIYIVAGLILSSSATLAAGDNCLQRARQAIDDRQWPQAQQQLQQHLQHDTGDDDARFTLARLLAWQKHYPQALEQFNRLLARQPDNSDYLLARARLHQWMGHEALALQDLQYARELSPDYAAVWQQQIRLLHKQNSNQLSTLLQRAQQRFPHLDWSKWLPVSTKPRAPAPRYSLRTSAGHDNLDNNRSAWKQASIAFGSQTTEASAQLQLDSFERFDLRDWQLAGSLGMVLQPTWRLTLNSSLSPGARVIARYRLETVLSKQFAGGFTLHGGMQYASFSNTDSTQLHLTGEYYWSHYRGSYSYRLIDVAGAGSGHNQRLALSRSYADSSVLTLSLASGKDVEYDGTATPPVSQVRTVSLYGKHGLQAGTALTWSLFTHQQGTFYTRNGFILGAQFDF